MGKNYTMDEAVIKAKKYLEDNKLENIISIQELVYFHLDKVLKEEPIKRNYLDSEATKETKKTVLFKKGV